MKISQWFTLIEFLREKHKLQAKYKQNTMSWKTIIDSGQKKHVAYCTLDI